jgi:molybdate transport system permease protein
MLTADETQALWLSARVASIATLLCLPGGIALAWLLARREFPGKFVLDVLVQLPMVLPPVVPGYVLLLLFGVHGPLGALLLRYFGLTLAFNWKGAVLASAVMAFPLMVQPIRIAFRMIDHRLDVPEHQPAAGRTRHHRRRPALLQPRAR